MKTHPLFLCILAVFLIAHGQSSAQESAARKCLFLDLSSESFRQVVVDRQAGQYLGHPTTVLLEDGKTIVIV